METRSRSPLLPSVIVACLTLLILFAGYAVTHRWDVTGGGRMKLDRWTGSTYRFNGDGWQKLEN